MIHLHHYHQKINFCLAQQQLATNLPITSQLYLMSDLIIHENLTSYYAHYQLYSYMKCLQLCALLYRLLYMPSQIIQVVYTSPTLLRVHAWTKEYKLAGQYCELQLFASLQLLATMVMRNVGVMQFLCIVMILLVELRQPSLYK